MLTVKFVISIISLSSKLFIYIFEGYRLSLSEIQVYNLYTNELVFCRATLYNRMKLMFVGVQGIGKTSLLNQLKTLGRTNPQQAKVNFL